MRKGVQIPITSITFSCSVIHFPMTSLTALSKVSSSHTLTIPCRRLKIPRVGKGVVSGFLLLTGEGESLSLHFLLLLWHKTMPRTRLINLTRPVFEAHLLIRFLDCDVTSLQITSISSYSSTHIIKILKNQ